MRIETIHEVTGIELPPEENAEVTVAICGHGEITLSIRNTFTHETICLQMYQPLFDMIHDAIHNGTKRIPNDLKY